MTDPDRLERGRAFAALALLAIATLVVFAVVLRWSFRRAIAPYAQLRGATRSAVAASVGAPRWELRSQAEVDAFLRDYGLRCVLLVDGGRGMASWPEAGVVAVHHVHLKQWALVAYDSESRVVDVTHCDP